MCGIVPSFIFSMLKKKSLPEDMLLDFRERGRDGERERGRERSIDVREKYLVAS